MRHWFGALLLILSVGGFAVSQAPRIYTQPSLPPQDLLDRAELQPHWRTKIRMYSKRDGLASVQVIPWQEKNPQVLVQTISGGVFLFDAETGDRLWEATVGDPYEDSQPPAWNSHSILTTRREILYFLDRRTGAQRLFTPDPYSKQPRYGYALLAVPSAAPVADDISAYFCMENRIVAYTIPNFAYISALAELAKRGTPEAKEAEFNLQNTPRQPAFLWSFLLPDMQFEQPLLWSPNQVAAVSTDGRLSSFDKFQRLLRHEYHFRKGVAAAMAQHGEVAYIGSLDFNLYALNMTTGSLSWRFTSGSRIYRRPAVNDAAVYVTSDRVGMNCVERGAGVGRWLNRDADRFLAANQRFVYAADRFGELLILDQLRGRSLLRLPMREYNMPVFNEFTDRLYFASHDGQIVCLRHREQRLPLEMKSDPWKAKPMPEAPAEAAPAVGAN